ncbi:hypothetical protein [Roseospira goensis]|uniref:Uncharacterized protein n=1 Tax=Roseospira goensis TaxID=391922 RepID=A0A7W6S3T9_9PROT|nr:hypothetical protein [Roseospira goensis]MBB4287667.1 hypothetical protein [Roseospira goensis]
MPAFTVTRAGWLTDAGGAGRPYVVGEPIVLTETQAAYLLRAEQIAPEPAASTAPGRQRGGVASLDRAEG